MGLIKGPRLPVWPVWQVGRVVKVWRVPGGGLVRLRLE